MGGPRQDGDDFRILKKINQRHDAGMKFFFSPRIRCGFICWLAAISFLVSGGTNAQQLPPPTFSKKLNSRTIIIKTGWDVDFQLAKAGQVVAHLQISSETDWEDPQLPGILLEVAVDERLASHLVTYMGSDLHFYSVHLGMLAAGPHNLAVIRADSSIAAIKLRQVRIDVYQEAHPFYPILAHAPVIFGRSRQTLASSPSHGSWAAPVRLDDDMRVSDVPLILAYEQNDLPTGKEFKYTFFFSNENGGTPPPGLLHSWGRYTDIEWAYRVEFDDKGKRFRGYFQGPEHKEFVYYGGFENDQPALQVATLNNLFSDSLTTKLRFALPPFFAIPRDGLRETVMLQAPWSWRVSAREARREQNLNPHPTDSTRIADLRRYLYIQFFAEPETPGVPSGGFFIAKFKNQPNEYASHLWSSDLVIRSDSTIARQTAVPLPVGTRFDDLQRLEFVADPNGGAVVLTNISRLFSLDENDTPHEWKPSWHGRMKLEPGKRAVFYVEGFQLRPARYFALPNEWHFKPDSQATGNATSWEESQLWPTIRVGEPWEQQGYPNYDGIAWYRCQFRLEDSWQSERIWLGFGGVDDRYQLWVNGKPARDKLSNDDSHFTVTEITPFVQFGKTNNLAVRVEDFGGEGGIIAPPVGIGNFPEAFAQVRPWPMTDPKIDDEKPFDYFRNPMTILGMKDNPAATLVTPEGAFYTGFVEMRFLGGPRLVPLNCRIKTLENDDLPLVHFGANVDSVDYTFEVFAISATEDSLSPLLNFVQVNIHNRSNDSRQARFALAPRFSGDHHRLQPQISFNPSWRYRVVGRFLFRDDRVLFSLPEEPFGANFLPPKDITPKASVGTIDYQWRLAPNESRSLAFCMPASPMLPNDALAQGVLTFDYEKFKARTKHYWQDLRSRGMQISLPEPKVNAAGRANLAYNFMGLDRHQGQLIQKVDKFHHDEFELRHAAAVVRMYDLFGYHDLAREILHHFLAYQKPDGHFAAREGQWGDFGPALWAFGQHFELTRDVGFAREVYPAVKRAVRWLHQARRNDRWHLFPALTVNDNAKSGGHFTGDNLYALLGLRYAIQLARAVGAPEDVSSFTREYESLRTIFMRKLNDVTRATEGSIPPVFEKGDDFHWQTPVGEHLVAVYPSQVLDPWDEKIDAMLMKMRDKFQEGLLAESDDPWAVQPWLYQDAVTYLIETEIMRGEQERAIADFYALLVHTSATHAGLHDPVRPWGDRTSCQLSVDSHQLTVGDYPCHQSAFAANFITLLRNMLLREQERDLHLFSAVAPAWLKSGEKISVQNAATTFGKVSFVAEVKADRLVIDFSTGWQIVPRYFVFHFPYFTRVERILVDGREIALQKDRANLSPHARRVEIFWQNRASRERINFDTTVEDFKREYRQRYRLWQAAQSQPHAVPLNNSR
jgi:hypothetical protein